MAIPYLGSKRKSAGKIYSTIKNLSGGDTLVDLFCGGFAVSEYFIKRGWNVMANDKNKYVIALLQKTIFDGLGENIADEFITREKFNDVLKNKDNYDDWYVGYVSCVWSFGNNQSGYMFGKDAEPYKYAGHQLVVHKDSESLKKIMPQLPQKYIDGVLSLNDWHKRRMGLSMVARRMKNRVLELQQLEQLERLQQLEQLRQLERLQFYSLDYREVPMPDGSVIYCDPPYQGTAEYAEGGFNHIEFWDWVREKSKAHKVFVSEYSAPEDFRAVLRFPQKSTYAGGVNNSQPDECLFIKI